MTTLLALGLLLLQSVVAQESIDTKATGRIGHVAKFQKELKVIEVIKEEDAPELPLEQAVRNVSGPDRAVILAITSSTYLDFVQNWFTSVQNLGQGGRVLFFAEDQEAYDFLRSRYPKQTVFGGRGRNIVGEAEKASKSDFNSAYFRDIVSRKPTYIVELLKLNVSVLFNDMDIVWRKDPFQFFKGDFDIWIQEDGSIFEGAQYRFGDRMPKPPILDLGPTLAVCTCFMFVRPTEGGKLAMSKWKQRIEDDTRWQGEPVHDQPELNHVLKHLTSEEVKVGVLPIQIFPSGCLYFGNPLCDYQHQLFKRSNATEEVAVVHNNWCSGHGSKLKRFRDHGLWLLKNQDGGEAAKE